MALTSSLRGELTRLLGARQVLTGDALSAAPPPGFLGDGGEDTRTPPDAVLFPTSTSQVSQVMALAYRERIPVTPRGAGTGKVGGCAPLEGGWVLSLVRMNRILDMRPRSAFAIVEPGVITGVFREAAEDAGLFYPPDPASLATCTLGGNVATNAGGPLAVKYGVTGDQVLGVEAVLMDGRVIRTGRKTLKGVSGYDLTSLLVGSEGTLGVLTSLTLRLRPQPEAVRTVLLPFASVGEAASSVARIWEASLSPRVLELLDGHALSALRRAGVGGVPERWGAVLLVEFDGEEKGCDAAVARLAELLPGTVGPPEIARNPAEVARLWAVRREMSAAVKVGAAGWITLDVAVPPERIPALCTFLDDVCDGVSLRVSVYGHLGDGNLHVNLLFDDPRHLKKAREVSERVYRQALHLEGTLTGEHGIGSTRRHLLGWEHGETEIGLMRALKAAWDPKGLLNPHKVLP